MGAWTSRSSSMFGGKISDHLDKDGINKFVRWSVEEIERTGEGLRTDALYRASGGHDDVQRIRGQPERGMQELLNQEPNVHVLTGALKQFFRSLKQPILRIEEFQEVLEGREHGKDASDQLVDIINNAPKLERPTLAFFFKHLFRVMHEVDNNMSLASLGVVFGPTLMRVATTARTEDVASVQGRIEQLNLVVELLLQHYCQTFNDHGAATLGADHRQPPSCTTQETLAGHLVTNDTTDISNSGVDVEGDDEQLPSSKDADTQLSSDIQDGTEHRSSSYHEAEEVGSGMDAEGVDDQQDNSSDETRDNLEVVSRRSDSGETPSLATLTEHTTRNSRSSTSNDDGRKVSVQSTGRNHEVRCSAPLDDPMSKSSDSDDIDSVLAHMAKALSPELDHYNDCDVGDGERRTFSWSSDQSASRASCDVETPSDDVEKSSVYRLSAPRISIIERSSSPSVDGETSEAPGATATLEARVEKHSTLGTTRAEDETYAVDPDMALSIEEKIRMFTKDGENVSSVKKPKVMGNQESEEEKKVKTEFEETFKKVTQQKSS